MKGNQMDSFVVEPKVALVGQSIMNIDGILEFLNDHEVEWPELTAKLESMLDLGDHDCEWLVEMAGRTCYMSFGGTGRNHEAHVKHLIEVLHGSVLEHIQFNFEIWNISRSCSHEIVRHRAGFAYSQISQRYVDSSKVRFIVPPGIQALAKINPDIYHDWISHCEKSLQLYEQLTIELAELYKDLPDKTERRKKARQAARSVLPNSTETKIFTSANGRAIRHFIEMRANAAADLEIRKLAMKMFRIMEIKFPLIIHGMKVIKLPDNTEAIESEFRKV